MWIGDVQELKKQGARIGRAGLALRVCNLVQEFQRAPSYKEAIILAGRLSAIAAACRFDDYWEEKAGLGFERELRDLRSVPAIEAATP